MSISRVARFIWSYRQRVTPSRIRFATITITTCQRQDYKLLLVIAFVRGFSFCLSQFSRRRIVFDLS